MVKITVYIFSLSILISLVILSIIPLSITNDGLASSYFEVLGNKDYCKIESFSSHRDSAQLDFLFLKEEDVFVGIEFDLKDSLIDLSRTNEILIDLRGTNTKFLAICLFALVQNKNFGISEVIIEKYLYLDREDGKYSLNINDFAAQPWWYKSVGLNQSDLVKPDFSKIRRFGVGLSNTVNIPINKSFTLQVNKIKVSYSFNLFKYLFAIVFIILICTLLIDLSKRDLFKIKAVDDEDKLKYDDNSTIKSEVTRFVGRYYNNSNIDAKHIAEITNTTNIKIDRILKSHYNLTFKQYLINVRLTEAERLLKESSCNVKEIASMVGFKHVSILNREFKKSRGMTPTELRKTLGLKS